MRTRSTMTTLAVAFLAVSTAISFVQSTPAGSTSASSQIITAPKVSGTTVNMPAPEVGSSGQRPPTPGFNGVIKLDVHDSKNDWTPYTPKKAPEGAPNFLFILYERNGC